MKSTEKFFMVAGALGAALAVGLGAFGAHGLRSILSAEMLAIYETGVRYQMYHSFGLLIAGIALERAGSPGSMKTAGWLFLLGILIFSGSLYILALTGQRYWGAVTPVGGIFFIAGWVAFLLSFLRKP